MATAEKPFIRQDGKDKVTGLGRYTADLSMTGMLEAKFRYADHAHARITRIDTSKAKALPGVFAVITHEDVPDVRYGPFVQDRRLFAKTKVRYEGELVAAVAALTPEIAQRAVELIEVDYEPLEIVSDAEAALQPGAPLLHEDWAEYGASEDVVRDGNDCSRSTILKGDPDKGMAEADIVVKERYVADMSHAVPIEPHAVVAQWQGDRVTIWSSTQVPFIARSGVATTLELPEAHVRIVVPHLGGGFGGKCEFHYEAQVAALARVAQRPVRLVFSRREEFLAPDHRREGQVLELETGVRRDGSIVARRGRLILDNGAYSADAPFFPQMAAMMAAGPYKIENVFIDASLAYTNTTPSGSVRAPTAPQACWALEQHMDSVAGQLGMDPVEFRRRNIVKNGDEGPTRQVFEDIGAAETLERAVELIGYGKELPEDEAIGRRYRLVAVVRHRLRCVREDQRGRVGHDHHRRTGVRHRCRDGAAAAGGGDPGHGAGELLAALSGHRRRAVRLRRIRFTDHLQQRPRRDGRGQRRAGAAARPGRRATGGQP